jgi:tetratricopeptide (TPR) repeat protein
MLATFFVYFPAIRGGMLWDDDAHVTRPDLQSWHGLARIWTDLGATEQYYPFLHSFFWVQHKLWGDATLGYHLVSILLHIASACLLAAILRRLSIPGAWLAAFLFALHPVCVESVAWISEQKNTLSLAFYLAAAWVYLRFDGQRRRRCYWIASGLFLLALLTKSVTATLPAALLVVFWWKRGGLDWRSDFLPLLPWFGLGAAMGLFTAWVERNYIGAHGSDFDLSLLERCLLAGRIIWFYLGKLVWPAELIFIYPRWRVDSSELIQWIYPLGALALAAGLWLLRRRTRAPLSACLFFAGSLFPTLGFFNIYPFKFSFVADHWQYLPSLGIIVFAAAALAPAVDGRPFAPGGERRAGPAAWPLGRLLTAAALVCLLGVLTWRQSRIYRDLPTLYEAVLDRNPDCWMAHNNLGEILRGEGRIRDAEGHFEIAVRLRPDYPIAHNNLGLAWRALGRTEDAIAQHREALRLQPGYAEAWNNLGGDLVVAGRLSEAVAAYEEALRRKPDYPGAEGNLAYALFSLGRLPEAIAHYEAALRLKPDSPEVHNNLAAILVKTGRNDEAIAHYQQAVKLRPDYLDARVNLAAVLHATGREDEARVQLDAISRLKAAGR